MLQVQLYLFILTFDLLDWTLPEPENYLKISVRTRPEPSDPNGSHKIQFWYPPSNLAFM